MRVRMRRCGIPSIGNPQHLGIRKRGTDGKRTSMVVNAILVVGFVYTCS